MRPVISGKIYTTPLYFIFLPIFVTQKDCKNLCSETSIASPLTQGKCISVKWTMKYTVVNSCILSKFLLMNDSCANLMIVMNMRPVPTKWETSRKISFESYQQIHDVQTLSFKMIYSMPGLLPYLKCRVQNPLFPWEIPLLNYIDFRNIQWAISPLVLWRLVAHFVRTGLIWYL